MRSGDRLISDRAGLLALPVLLCLSACAVGPDYVPPMQALPSQWNAASPTRRPPALSEWWRQFKDPALNRLVEEAVAGNLDVAQAKARIREARASRVQAIAPLFPQVDGSASVTRSRSASSGDSSFGNVTRNSFRAGFDTSWELDLFGARDRAIEAATYGADAAEDDLDGVLLTLVGDVASTVIEARGYQARIALARRTAATQRETEALTKVRFQAGAVSAADTARATAQVASTEAQIPALEIALSESLNRLAILIGRPPSAMANRLVGAGQVPATPTPPRAGVPADVLRSRPDVRRAERLLAQATARIGQAEAARYPAVSLTGNISTSALKLGDLAKNSAIGWSIGPSLSVPIFNGGELAAAVDVARAQRDQSDAALRLAVLTALQDVEDALVGLRQERLRLASLATAATASGEAARLSQTLYRSGGISFLDVLDAERSQYSAEDALIQSRIALATRFIALNKALGGGWLRPVEVSRPRVDDPQQGPRPRALTLEPVQP
ncbi:RND transporter [Bosea caraganae]|uniref:RND transporter n=1 Tax=Bosea caraganae TaxID=2763117 RepID=A0A370KYC8_9HYPH|nr:efflux transporter outer membrane subunit [Bosea caraganae]RDJ19988.1 RND transporter [Bosea caraganae]RDJ23928.1 RND transporter [Bosea caraganae]